MGNHCFNCLVFMPHVVFFGFLDIFHVDGRDDGFDGRDDGFNRHQVDHLLEGVFLPLNLMVLFYLEDISPLGSFLDSWVEYIGIINPLAVKAVVPSGKSHFGLAEYER